MRAPSFIIVVSLAAVAGACSRPAPHPDASLDRDLDLALDRAGQPDQVVSKIELEGETAAKPPAGTASRNARSDASTTRKRTADAIKLAGQPAPSPTVAATPATATEPAAEAPASTSGTASPANPPTADPAPADPKPDPEPAPEPTHTGRGGGWFPEPPDMGVPQTDGTDGIGIGLPGGGVIIIRGGGSGRDPCDRRHPGGIGGRGMPGMPGLPGGIGRGGTRRGPHIGGIGGIFRR